MNPNNSRTPGDGSKPGRTAGSQSWMTQMNDALGESDDENFLDFNLGPAFQSSHQRANSTSALATVAALPTAGINDRAQHGREMDRPLQMAGNQLLSFQPTYQPGQQVESQTPSSAFNPFGQAMVMSPRLSASTQPTTGTVSIDPINSSPAESFVQHSNTDIHRDG